MYSVQPPPPSKTHTHTHVTVATVPQVAAVAECGGEVAYSLSGPGVYHDQRNDATLRVDSATGEIYVNEVRLG